MEEQILPGGEKSTDPKKARWSVRRWIKPKYKRSSYRNITDLIALDETFEKNRSFNTWAEVFQKSLKGVRSNKVNQPRTYEELARRYPRKIVKIFLELLCDDLIHNNVSYVFNHRKDPEKQLILRMAAYAPDDYPTTAFKVRKSYYCHGGMKYGLKIDRTYKYYKINYRVGFYITRRQVVREQLSNGKRYYNSYKEKIYSQI